jgi:putative PIN family toxin of toxin-antitoxin system
LRSALAQGALRWLATRAMRDELQRVLDYPQILKRRAARGIELLDVLAQFDAQAHLVDDAPRAPVRCQDEDDQKFIDLAVAHRALLVSKDKAVLVLCKRLALHGVEVRRR